MTVRRALFATRIAIGVPAQSRRAAACGCVVLLLFAVRVDARPCGTVPADRAFSESVLILKGSLISTTNAGAPGSDSTSVIHVDRVVKGQTTGREITVIHFLCGIEYPIAMRKGRPLLAFVDGSGGLVGGTEVLPASTRGPADGSIDPKPKRRPFNATRRICRTAGYTVRGALAMIRPMFSGFMNAGNGSEPVSAE